MQKKTSRIVQGDCIRELKKLDASCVDLAFADPPFNIGYQYDQYQDNKPDGDYCDWSRAWMAEVIRVLKPAGCFWLAIGDEYAAELKVCAMRELGLTCRSWVVWYYTFGVHCQTKFSRSHAHLFYFVRDPTTFTFNDAAIRVPSARQLVYADKRADPRGRLPDDTWVIRPTPNRSWVLRPQDLPNGFSADSDTWYFPRVCGTFKERAGFHGCQMPEQLLGRIIRTCSNEGDLVLDPFAGSGTTLAVAKKLNRRYLGIEISSQYVDQSRKRLSAVRSGDPLDGSADPLTSVLDTLNGRRLNKNESNSDQARPDQRGSSTQRTPDLGSAQRKDGRDPRRITGLDDLKRGVIEAFEQACRGYSSDRVIADPDLNAEFVASCRERAIPGNPIHWNKTLLSLRKANLLVLTRKTKPTALSRDKVRWCEFASEIALARMRDQHDVSLDGLLCDPALASKFDALATEIAPGLEAVYHRWAALGLRKRAKLSRAYAKKVPRVLRERRFSRSSPTSDVILEKVPDSPGLYLLRDDDGPLYVGETDDLRRWVVDRSESGAFMKIAEGLGGQIRWAFFEMDEGSLLARRGFQSYQIGKRRPPWNYPQLAASVA